MKPHFLATAACLSLGLGLVGLAPAFAQDASTGTEPITLKGGQTVPNAPAASLGTTSASTVITTSTPPVAPVAVAVPGTPATLSPQDLLFVRQASGGGNAEIKLGALATQRGGTAQIRDLGQTIVTDHTKANEQLGAIAASEGFAVETAPLPRQERGYERLSATPAGQFDAVFTRIAVISHEHAVADFRKETILGTDPALKSFAAQTLPTLEEHLAMARQLPGAPAMSMNKPMRGPSNADNSADQLNGQLLQNSPPS